jgi:uncharacterized protein (DUF934 family)
MSPNPSATPRLLGADGSWPADSWSIVRDATSSTPRDGDVLPLAAYLALEGGQRTARVGVWVAAGEDVAALAPVVASLPLIAVDFPTFKDGRGYSSATLLRRRYRFTGELRAIGDVLVDQVFFMKRVGFSTFALRADQNPDSAKAALATFSDAYQASVDQPLPHYRRRSAAVAQ